LHLTSVVITTFLRLASDQLTVVYITAVTLAVSAN